MAIGNSLMKSHSCQTLSLGLYRIGDFNYSAEYE